MKIPKHVAGLALFILIVSVSAFIAHALTEPLMTMQIPPVPLDAQPFSRTAVQPVGYQVRLVSLDFINQKSYTTLTLRRQPGDFWPERLWVYTSFFVPELPGRSWSSGPFGLIRPFADDDEISLTLSGTCPWCADASAPRHGYYARVIASTMPLDTASLRALQTDTNIETAIPVLVQVDKKLRP